MAKLPLIQQNTSRTMRSNQGDGQDVQLMSQEPNNRSKEELEVSKSHEAFMGQDLKVEGTYHKSSVISEFSAARSQRETVIE